AGCLSGRLPARLAARSPIPPRVDWSWCDGGTMSEPVERFDTREAGEARAGEKLRCDACPVMCYIAEGRTGACDRYGNVNGRIVRRDPVAVLEYRALTGGEVVPFADAEWDGN